MKAWSDTEQAWDSAPACASSNSSGSAAICVHPKELETPGVQSSSGAKGAEELISNHHQPAGT